MKNQKGFAHLFVVVVFLVILVMVGFWLWRSDKLNFSMDNSSPIPVISEIKMNHWNLYKSSTNPVLFKIPSDWTIVRDDLLLIKVTPQQTINWSPTIPNGFEEKPYIQFEFSEYAKGYNLNDPFPEDLDYDQIYNWVKRRIDEDRMLVQEIEELIIAGQPALSYIRNTLPGCDKVVYIVPENDNLPLTSITTGCENPHQLLVDQILSTFEFTN